MPEPAKQPFPGPISSLAGHAPLTSAAFVAGLRAGDDTAFARLFHELYIPLCDFGANYVKYDVAEDLAQDVLFRLWDARARIQPDKSIRGYLYRAMYHAILNYKKRWRLETRWRQQREAESSGGDRNRQPSVAELTLADAEIDAAVDRALATLPERCRLVYQLRWHHQLSYLEIADAMQISPKTVENQIARALKTLREALAPLVDQGSGIVNRE